MTQPESVHTQLSIRSMDSGDTVRAIAATRDLAASIWERKPAEVPIEGMIEPFRALLQRRGYFVSTPTHLATSLEEILALGEGFDLYDLARQLAAVDTVATDCLKRARLPLFPELRAFAPRCPCGGHPMISR